MSNEFSIRAMKDIINSYTSKRVSRDSAEELGNWLSDFGENRSDAAIVNAKENDRKTVRAMDFKKTQDSSPRKTGTDVVNAPVERLIRNAGAERVADSATEELKKEVLAKAEKIAQEVDRLASHANRNTIQAVDFKLARDRGEI